MSFVKYLLTVPLKRKRFFIFALLVGFTLSCFLLLSDLNLDLVLKYSHRLPVLPTAQAEYRQLIGKIANATADELLADETHEEPRIYTESWGCIAAQGYRAYGTNRLQEEIVKDYGKAFFPMVWETGETGSGFKVVGTGTKTIGIQIVFIDPISPDFSEERSRFQTIYRVQVIYADPAIFGCFG